MANAATWERRVAQWRASGLTAADFAKGRGFAPGTLTWWSSRLNQLGAKTAEFPMVRVVAADTREVEQPAQPRRASGVTVVVGAVRVEVEVGFDAATLEAVVAAVEGRA